MLTRLTIRALMKTPAWCLGIVCLVAMAVGIYAGTFIATSQIQRTTTRIYDELRLFDLEIRISPTPVDLLPPASEIVRKIPGVASATHRLLVTGTVELEGGRTAGAIITAVSPHRRPAVGDIRIIEGSFLIPGRPHDVVIDATFADDMGLTVGDTFTLRSNTKQRRVIVAGIGIFPEFLMSSVDDNFSVPVRRTAVAIMLSHELVADAAETRRGGINDIAIEIAPGHAREVVRAAILEYFESELHIAVVGTTWPEDHYSVRCNATRIAAFEEFLPVIITLLNGLAFSSLLLFVVRMLKRNQAELSTLVALGITRKAIVIRWMFVLAALVTVGAAVGTLGAFVLANRIIESFMNATGFPVLFPDRSTAALGQAWGVSLATIPLAVVLPVLITLRHSPAELFQRGVDRPQSVWAIGLARRVDVFLSYLPGLGFSERLGVRNVVRRPLACVVSILGLSGMLVMASSMYVFADGIEQSLDDYLAGHRWDYLVEFGSPQQSATLGRTLAYAGATAWEPLWVADTTIEYDGRSLSCRLVAGPVPSSLHRENAIVFGRMLTPRTEGDLLEILIDLHTARILGLQVKDSLVLLSEGRSVHVRVVGVASNFNVNQVLVAPATVHELFGPSQPPNAAVLTGPPDLALQLTRMKEIVRLLPGKLLADAARHNFRAVSSFCRLYGNLSVIVGAILVLVLLTMNSEDRKVGYALLRSHGYRVTELLRSLVVEVVIIAVVAIVISYPLTKMATHVFQMRLMQISDFYPLRMGFGPWLSLMAPALGFMILGLIPTLHSIFTTNAAVVFRDRVSR